MYRPEDIFRVTAFDHVLRNQERFFRGGVYTPQELAGLISLEPLLLGASELSVVSSDGWISVYADVDWLDGLAEVFDRLVPLPVVGPNSVTSEYLAVVFSSGVVSATMDNMQIIKGESHGPLAGRLSGKWRRAVAFRID